MRVKKKADGRNPPVFAGACAEGTHDVPPMAPPLYALSPDQDHETLFRFQSDLASVESNATHRNAIACSLSGQPVANCWLATFGLTRIFNSNSH